MAAQPDFRRRRRADLAATLAERSIYLPPEDRQLILTVYAHGRPLRHVAVLMGVSYRHLRRRAKRLVRRLLSPTYAYVALVRDQWPPTMKAVATQVVLNGRSLRHAAVELKLSYHTVRRQRDAIVAMAAGAAGAARAAKVPTQREVA